LEQAVAADPGYALAFADLSLQYGGLASSRGDPKIYMPKAEAAARRAVELDPDLPDGHVALARSHREDWRWQEAEIEYQRALELDPNNARAHGSFGTLLARTGRYDQSLAEVKRAQELDPLGDSAGLGYALVWARRFDEAIAEFNRVIETDPKRPRPYALLSYAYAGKGMYREAIAAVQQAIQLGAADTSNEIYLASYYAHAGEKDKATAILQKLQTTKDYVSPGELAVLHTALGDHEAAFASLETAFAQHDPQLLNLTTDASYDAIRSDPRFASLVRRVGFPGY
jgi:tetratricopeptide (TPR) repeat protein